MGYLWNIDIDDFLEAVKRAKKNGKKEGDSIEEEFLEVMSEKNQKPFGETEMDLDLLSGNLRENGVKVLNINELQRKIKDQDH